MIRVMAGAHVNARSHVLPLICNLRYGEMHLVFRNAIPFGVSAKPRNCTAMDENEFLVDLSQSENSEFGHVEFADQSIPQKIFSSVWCLESEVNNGGFVQYFENSSAETAPFVVYALESIGAFKASDICRRAIAVAFPEGMPPDGEAISDAASNFTQEIQDKLDELDSEFFTYPDDLTGLLHAFVAKHPEEFGEIAG